MTLEGVWAAYGSHVALQDVHLVVRRGEFVALVGDNGAGKSTLARLLVGLVRPSRGRVFVEGDDLRGQSVRAVCRRVAYLPQNPSALLFADTVRDELLVTLRNHGLRPERAPVAPDDLLRRLGLEAVVDMYPRDLSVGQRERVALGALLVTRPPVLVLDEPTRGLDWRQKEELVAMLKAWQAEGTTILFVTHDVELVALAADRVVVLEEGRVVADGPVRPLLGTLQPFAPQMARLFGHPELLTVEDVLAAVRPADEEVQRW
ncbi:MAG: ABC transporter ATP-binding protein [Ardenticatenia bacterium]|nr:ABC transporter ATP-binding protein [Ardenticatenia bacterium]